MQEANRVLSFIKQDLPDRLDWIWRHSFAIFFLLSSLAFLVFDPERLADYGRIFEIAIAIYLAIISSSIIYHNFRYYREIKDDAGEMATKIPLHILYLGVGTTGAFLTIAFFWMASIGEEPTGPTALIFLFDFFGIVIILGLNFIWRFVISRSKEVRTNVESASNVEVEDGS